MITIIKTEQVSVTEPLSKYLNMFKEWCNFLQLISENEKENCLTQIMIITTTYLNENNELKIENVIDLQVAPVRNLKNEYEDIK